MTRPIAFSVATIIIWGWLNLLYCQVPMEKFYATGLTFQQYSHPELTGWGAVGIPIDKSREDWSFSAYLVIPTKLPNASFYTLRTITQTGLATHLRSLGPLHLFGVGMGGFVTDGKNSGEVVMVGPLAVLPFIKKWKLNLLLAYLKTKTNLPGKDPDSYWAGIGRAFK